VSLRGLSALALAAVLTAAAGARAQAEDPSARWSEGQAAEARGDVEAALGAYRAVVSAAPTSRLASRAERRLAWLDERDDDPRALSWLLAFLGLPSRSAVEVEAFAELAEGMPAGVVRRESFIAIATEWDRLSQAEERRDEGSALAARAEDAYEAARREPGLSDGEREHLLSAEASLLARLGRGDEALLLLDRGGRTEGSLRARLHMERLDRWLRPVAWSLLAASLAGLLLLLARASRSERRAELAGARGWLVPLGAVAYAVGVPYLLGRWYSHEAEQTLSLLAPALGAVLLQSAVAGRCLAITDAPRPARALALTLSVAAPLAASYLALFDAGDGPLAH
jgi:hypothetical protein